jgi:hypothetical protein
MKTVIYISGPMEGKPGKNFDNFSIAATAFRDAGYTVLNPAEWRCYPDGTKTHQWYLDRDIAKLQETHDAGYRVIVYSLSGWADSSGARAERNWAEDAPCARWSPPAGVSAEYSTLQEAVEWHLEEYPPEYNVLGTYPCTSYIFPTGAAERKEYPVFTGLLEYFPHACAAVAHHSHIGNEQHNPGEPLHWAREKSIGDGDQIVRHLMEGDYTAMAWRALELLERSLTPEEDTHGA